MIIKIQYFKYVKQCEPLKLKAVSFTKKGKHCSPLNTRDILGENQWLNVEPPVDLHPVRTAAAHYCFLSPNSECTKTSTSERVCWSAASCEIWLNGAFDTAQLLWLCPLWFQTYFCRSSCWWKKYLCVFI